MLRSLKATLMVWVVLVMLVIVPVRAYFGLLGQVALNDSAYDVALGDWAVALGNLVDAGADGELRFELNTQTEELLRTTGTGDNIYYVVIGPRGQVLAGDAPLADPPMQLQRGERRLLDAVHQGQPVRMAVHAVECGRAICQVRVAETLLKRESTRDDTVLLTASLSAGGCGSSNASSASVRSAVSGVRSWCAASAMKWRWRAASPATRRSSWSTASSSGCSSLGTLPRRSGRRSSSERSASCAFSDATGRIVRVTTTQIASASSAAPPADSEAVSSTVSSRVLSRLSSVSATRTWQIARPHSTA